MTELVLSLNGIAARNAQGTKISRSMSYTGCWTCRRRRIKCDERPVACRTCEDAKLECAGYDVRLIWNAGSKRRVRKPPASRRQIQPDKSTYHPMTEDEVLQTLTKIDKAATKPATTSAGPFSVFALSPPPQSRSVASDTCKGTIEARECSCLQETYEDSGKQISSLENDGLDFVLGGASPFQDDAFECLDTPLGTNFDALIKASDLSAMAIADDISFSDQDRMGESMQHFTRESPYETPSGHNVIVEEEGARGNFGFWNLLPPNLEKIASIPAHTSNIPLQNSVLSERVSGVILKVDYSLSTALVANTTAAMLINHYTSHLVHLMQPISHQGNPFRTIYLPLAIEGSSALEVARDPDRIHPTSVTVFHSLLSTAAINLQDQPSGRGGLQQLAWHHKQRALVALRSALAAQSCKYKDLMTAILSLVSTDIIGGGISDHWIHLEAAVQLQASRHYGTLVSRETRLLNTISGMLHLFAQTTLHQPEPKPWLGFDHGPNGDNFDFLDPSIEFIYGITTTIARAILKVYRLTQCIVYYKDREYPQSLMQTCETLGDELCSWTISSEPFSTLDSTQEHTLEIARAQARAFHSAALIYYYRGIQNCARSCLRQEQQSAIAAMNEAEDLRVSLGDNGTFSAPITWPAFIASCEAVDQDRQDWDKWWSRVQRYRMGNYHKQLGTVHQVWADLDKNEPTGDWRTSLATMNLRIIPV